MTDQATEILEAKRDANGYLWVHDSGDVILWPTEEDSVDDDGANAVARWDVSPRTLADLIASGECDEIA